MVCEIIGEEMKQAKGEMLFEMDQRQSVFVEEIKHIVKRRHRFRVEFMVKRYSGSLTRLLKAYWKTEEK